MAKVEKMSLLNYFFVFNHLLNKKTIINSEYFERDLLKNKNKDLAVTINRDYAIEFSGKFEFVEENSWIYTSPAGEKCPLTVIMQ